MSESLRRGSSALCAVRLVHAGIGLHSFPLKLIMDKERMRSEIGFPWLWSMRLVSFSALTWLVGHAPWKLVTVSQRFGTRGRMIKNNEFHLENDHESVCVHVCLMINY